LFYLLRKIQQNCRMRTPKPYLFKTVLTLLVSLGWGTSA
jgi:hypothetical protein